MNNSGTENPTPLKEFDSSAASIRLQKYWGLISNPKRTLPYLILMIFVSEVIAMLTVRFLFDLPPVPETLLDASILVVLLVLAYYFVLFIPLHSQITKQKQIELKIKQLSTAVEQSPASIVITDPSGTIEYVNPKFTEVTGYKYEEVIGQNPRVLKSGSQPVEFYSTLWKTITSGKEWRGDFCNRKKNGEVYWENASISPIKSSTGEITHFVAVKEDITERKLAEEALEAAEKRYRQLVEETSDTVFTIDLEGTFTYVNPSAETITGYEESELIGMSFTQLIRPDWLDRVQGFYREQRDKSVPETSLEFPIITKQGETRWVEQTVNAVIEEGQLASLQATVRDVTERKQAEEALRESREKYRDLSEELKKANVTKDKFFSIIAHDLRGPLGNFHALSKMFVSRFERFPPDKIKEMIEQLHTSASQSYKLLENLLDWSRLQLGRMEFKPEPLSIAELTEENVELFNSQAKEKDLSLINSTDPTNTVLSDRNMLTTVMRNLISNAIKFTPRGGEIVISSSTDETQGNIVVCVTDTGIGMSEEILESIFDVESYHTTLGTEKEKGTGLGLPLCKEFIEKNNGKIRVESELGRGSRFSFELPAVA
ncbi:MAG: PAS domain-containing sensor histidine kinase [Fidelibacterota bacterium]|nr:MAG: PAS domain-containing sensor histidine kinase [Candidatus Neomarinimicrobiota bacterium]